MSALREFKVLVRQNSTVTTDYLIKKYKRVMNSFQEADKNKNADGGYIFIWYAEIFDSRDNRKYRIYCDYATNLYSISNEYTCEDGTNIKGVAYLTAYIDTIEQLEKEVAKLKDTQATANTTNKAVPI